MVDGHNGAAGLSAMHLVEQGLRFAAGLARLADKSAAMVFTLRAAHAPSNRAMVTCPDDLFPKTSAICVYIRVCIVRSARWFVDTPMTETVWIYDVQNLLWWFVKCTKLYCVYAHYGYNNQPC